MSTVKSFLSSSMDRWRARPPVAQVSQGTGLTGFPQRPAAGQGFVQSPVRPGGFSQPAQLPAFNPSGANQPAANAQPVPTAAAQGSSPGGGVSAAANYLNPQSVLMQGYNNTALGNTNLDITQAAGYGMSDYGYTGQDTNNDGIPDAGFAVDPNNPYSKAAALQRAYDQRGRGIGTSMAAQGQLYSGANQRLKDDNEFQRGGAEDANQQAFKRLMEELIRKRRDASLGTEQANSQINWDALVASLQSRPT